MKKRAVIGYCIIFLLVILTIGLNKSLFLQVWCELRELSAKIILLACILALLYRFTEGILIYLLSNENKSKINIWKCVEIVFAGSFFRIATFGSGGMAAKIVYLKKQGIDVGEGTGVCLIQFVFYKIAVLFMGLYAFIRYPGFLSSISIKRVWVYIGLAVCIFIVAFIIIISVSKKVTDFIYNILWRIFKNNHKAIDKIDEVFFQVNKLQEESKKVFKNKGKCMSVMALSVIMQALAYVVPCTILCKNKNTIRKVFNGMALAYMLSGAVPVPSGIGSLEMIFISLMKAGFKTVNTASAILMYRFTSIIVPFFAGILAVILLKK